MVKKFINNLIKYNAFIRFSVLSELKTEVANSKLNWLWWVIEPVCFSMIYVFIVQVVFGSSIEYVGVFVLIGQTLWIFFEKNIKASVKVMKTNKPIISKVYIPKYILILVKMFTLLFKLMISSILIILLMICYGVPFTLNSLMFIPILFILFIFIFGTSLILCHYGVFTGDLVNIINILMKLMFYLTGIFYSIADRVEGIYGVILEKVNPIAFFISTLRDSLLYGNTPDYLILFVWFIISVLLCVVGIHLINKYENTYAKVV